MYSSQPDEWSNEQSLYQMHDKVKRRLIYNFRLPEGGVVSGLGTVDHTLFQESDILECLSITNSAGFALTLPGAGF